MAEARTRTFAGIDALRAATNAFIVAVVAGLAWFALPTVAQGAVTGIAALGIVLALGARYRLEISPAGIAWTRWVAWVWPAERLRYGLDAKVGLYWALEDEKPSGVCVQPPWLHYDPRESPCFGPTRQASIHALCERANAAIAEARAHAPPTPTELRCPWVSEATTDLAGAKRNVQGRIVQLTTRAPLVIGGLALPTSTTLVLNESSLTAPADAYIDPRRDDRLVAAILHAPASLPNGLGVPAGTRVSFSDTGHVSTVRGALGPIEREGFAIDGDAPIGFDDDGSLHSFTLGKDTDLGGWRIRAGAHFAPWLAISSEGRGWCCTLAAPLVLPEVTLAAGDLVVFDEHTRKLRSVHPRNGLELDGERLVGPVWVGDDGRIDRRRARS